MTNKTTTMHNNTATEEWDLEIKPQGSVFNLHLDEIWRYRDLLLLFVRRDFIAVYKQTILGPLWHVIQPIFTTITFTIIFNRVAGISTDGVPAALFYFSGITIWIFFSKCLMTTSNTFLANANIFSKVYFPRLIMPLSSVIGALIAFTIQFGLLIVIYGVFIMKGSDVRPTIYLAALPLLLLIMATMGLGLGIMISSMTTKYRDLKFFLGFGVQLIMYVTPVIYPISQIPEQFQKYALLNPLAPVLEGFKYALLGAGTFNINMLIGSGIAALVIFFIGIMMFNRIENRFVDTV